MHQSVSVVMASQSTAAAMPGDLVTGRKRRF